ncbi:hypothetical protein N7478_011646 [Penicillium angulare]|uniref:uncharacterized protein n=1 Tax=Penicillium angulare TaxID=116970 RepID=UPI00254162C9|nr:uncharacterized protein N7478_011646 [Penicillium angulare]KAJ5261051.1 hypothetical protein N7478_011646 [Penicillium angulare]
MSQPIELSIFPSCFGAIDWSPDGEIAVAAGDQVHIFTWKPSEQNNSETNGWHATRIPRVNAFTSDEWGVVFPQNREDASIGVEQSPSTVLGLTWSPSGLARYRRSVLAILTSNLILSLWEPIGPNGQWIRLTIVNHALYPSSDPSQDLGGADLRSSNIRSFQWCTPIQVPQLNTSSSKVPPESRWGVQLLAVTTDANEIVLLRVHRPAGLQASSQAYVIKKLHAHLLDGAEKQFPMVHAGSLFQKALQSKSRITSISCSPWLNLSNFANVYSATTVIAVVYGSQLRFLQAKIGLMDTYPHEEMTPRHEVMVDFKDHEITKASQNWDSHRISGPLKWLHTGQSEKATLSVGTLGSILTISCPLSIWDCSNPNMDEIDVAEWPFSDETDQNTHHMQPISSLINMDNEDNATSTLHLGTAGRFGGAIDISESGDLSNWHVPQWKKQVTRYEEGYDLDRDLGGHTVTRIWGLSAHRGLIAFLFTMHPTNMIEYRMISTEKTFLGFIDETTGKPPDYHALFLPSSEGNEGNSAREQRAKVISFILSTTEQESDADPENQKLSYAAVCCAIVDKHSESIRAQAQRCLERLSSSNAEADLSEEISKCNDGSSTISARKSNDRTGPGSRLYEWCEICDAGISWESPREAQCENGHLFVRCGLSLLAIQEPGMSKFCPFCRTEYFDEDLLARTRGGDVSETFVQLFEAFDTCIYCNRKFQASIQG